MAAAAILFYLLVINVMTLAAFADDKRRAVAGTRRMPERTLLGLAALGGTVGAYVGRHLLRHKTRKQPFGAWLGLIASAQFAAVAVGWVLLRP